jgi:hypothetical protein
MLLSTSLNSDAIAHSGGGGGYVKHGNNGYKRGNNGYGNGGGDGSPNGKYDKYR